MGHLLHHQGLALDEEMIHEEQVGDRERAAAEADLYGQGPAPRRVRERALRGLRGPLLRGPGAPAGRGGDARLPGRRRLRRRARGARRLRAAAGGQVLRRVGPVRRRRLPRRGDPRRDRPLRVRERRRPPAGSSRCSSPPASRAPSACSPSTTWIRRWRAPAGASATRARTPPGPCWRWPSCAARSALNAAARASSTRFRNGSKRVSTPSVWSSSHAHGWSTPTPLPRPRRCTVPTANRRVGLTSSSSSRSSRHSSNTSSMSATHASRPSRPR